MRNHSATHLMHKALREVLGGHVQQKGSLVDAEHTRFDFSHNAPVTRRADPRGRGASSTPRSSPTRPTEAHVMAYDDAVKGGAMALFGEKYGDEVRVLDIGSSRELCGGTHVARTGDIGLFKIVSEGGVAAGIRRVEAITGENALAYVQQLLQTLNQRGGRGAKAPVAELPDAHRPGAGPVERAGDAKSAQLQGEARQQPRRRTGRAGGRRQAASRCWPRRWTARMPGAARDGGQAEGQARRRRPSCWPRVDDGKVS